MWVLCYNYYGDIMGYNVCGEFCDDWLKVEDLVGLRDMFYSFYWFVWYIVGVCF